MKYTTRVIAIVTVATLACLVAASTALAAVVVDGASAQAFGVKAHVQLLGRDILNLPPVALAAAPDASGANTAVAQVLGPIRQPADGSLISDLRVLSSHAARTNGALPTAHADAVVTHLALIEQAGKPLIEADVIHSVADVKCTGPNAAVASSDGSRLIGLSINGQKFEQTPPKNTTVPLFYNGGTPADPTDDRGIKIILNEQTGASKGTGIIVTMIHVIIFDALTPNLVFADVRVAQAKATTFCGEAAPATDGNAADRGVASDKIVTTTTSDIKGAVDGTEATAFRGDTVTWKITMTNPGTTGCALVVVTDTLPQHFALTKTEGDLTTAVAPTLNGQEIKWSNGARYKLPAGGTLTETIIATVDKDAPLGTYTNLLDIDESTCSSFTQGNRGPVTVIERTVVKGIKTVKPPAPKPLQKTGLGVLPFAALLIGSSMMVLGTLVRRRMVRLF